MSSLFQLIFLICIIIAAVVVGPWCFIWSINTLAAAGGATAFNIPFTFWTWLAATICIGFAIRPSVRHN